MNLRHLLILGAFLAPFPALADPFTVIAFAATAASHITVAGVALLSAGTAFAITVASAAFGAIHARRKAKKAAAAARAEYNSKLEDRSVTALRADPPWRVIYGECIVGGDIVDIFTTDNENARKEDGTIYTKADGLKHMIIVLASHECESITDVYLDGLSIGALDINGWAIGTTAEENGFYTSSLKTRRITINGTVTLPETPISVLGAYSGALFLDDPWVAQTVTISGNQLIGPPGIDVNVDYTVYANASRIRIGKHLGTPTQTVDAYFNGINPTRYTADHRLRGLTYVAVTLDLEDSRFQGGPPNLTFKVKGHNKIFDTRTSTYGWSENPALIANNFLLSEWGGKCLQSEINVAFVNAAANVCDTLIDLTIGGVTTSSMLKYTCNGAFTSNDSPESVLDDITSSMAGQAVYGGEWQITAGAWTAPIMTLTDDDLSGQIEIIQADTDLDTLFNGVRGQYIPADTTTPVDFEPYSNSVFVASDGVPLWVNKNLMFTNNKARARNLVRIELEEARSGQTIRFPAKLRAWPLQVGDRVTVTSLLYGITSKVYRVTDWNFGTMSPVNLILQEDAPEIWDLADATEADQTPNNDLVNPWKVDAVAGVTVASGNAHFVMTADGSVSPRAYVTWTPIEDSLVINGGKVVVSWRFATTPDWIKADVNPADSAVYLTGVKEGKPIIVEVYAVNSKGVTGPSTIIIHTVGGKTDAPPNVAGLAYSITATGVRLRWNPPAILDYDYTELRYGAVGSAYGASTFFWRGASSEYTVVPPTDGTWDVWAVHYNRSGIASVAPTLITVVYTALSITQTLDIGNSSSAFIFDSPTATTSSSPVITLDAILGGGAAGVVVWETKAYNAAGVQVGLTDAVPLTTTSGNNRSLSYTQFNIAGGTTTKYVVVKAMLGTLSDVVTIHRGDNGGTSLTLLLGNENVNVPSNADGSSPVLTNARAQWVRMFEGITDVTALWTFSIAITVGTGNALINGGAGPVSGTAIVDVNLDVMTSDEVIVTITATRSGFPTTTAFFRATKAKAGVPGTPGISTFVLELFLLSATAPAAPTNGVTVPTYNVELDLFTPGSLSPGTWSRSKPSATVTDAVWRTAYTFSTSTPDIPVPAGTWSTPVKVAQLGAQGDNGDRGSLTGYSTSVTPPIYSLDPWDGATDDANASTVIWQMLGNSGTPPTNAHLVIGDTVTLRNDPAGTTPFPPDPFEPLVIFAGLFEGTPGAAASTSVDVSSYGRSIGSNAATLVSAGVIQGSTSLTTNPGVTTSCAFYDGGTEGNVGTQDWTWETLTDVAAAGSQVVTAPALLRIHEADLLVWAANAVVLHVSFSAPYTAVVSFWAYNYSTSVPLLVGTTDVRGAGLRHIAVSRVGNDWFLGIHGTIEDTATWSGSLTDGRRRYIMGSASDVGPMVGVSDMVRETVGEGRYSSTYTPLSATPSLVLGKSKTKFWDGVASWRDPGQIIDGNLLVTGSISTSILIASELEAIDIRTGTIDTTGYVRARGASTVSITNPLDPLGPSVPFTIAVAGNESLNAEIGVVGFSDEAAGYGVVGVNLNGTGVIGISSANYGVQGKGVVAGIYGISMGTGAGVLAKRDPSSIGSDVALQVEGPMIIDNSTLVANLNADMVDGIHFGGVGSGTATATPSLNTKPGSNSTGVWLQQTHGATVYWVQAYPA